MKMNKKTLSIIMAVEAALIACVCIGLGGLFLYNGGFAGNNDAPAVQPEEAVIPENPAGPATATAIPEPTPRLDNTTIEKLPEGATRYIDQSAGFELIVPTGWLAVRPNSDEFNAALSKAESTNQMLKDQMAADQANYDPNFDRLYAYILHPEIQEGVMFGMSKLAWDVDDNTQLDNKTLGELLRGLESSGAIPGFRANFSSIIENGRGIPIIVIKGRFAMDDGQGGSVPFSTTLIVFKPTPTSVARITFSFLQDFEDTISADIDALIESITIFAP